MDNGATPSALSAMDGDCSVNVPSCDLTEPGNGLACAETTDNKTTVNVNILLFIF
jgi:hypothetical protein